jgi:[protein-PII] uridylyltransferase
MREVDAAVDAALAEPAGRGWWPWSRRTTSTTAPFEAASGDLDRLLAVLRGVEPTGPLEPLPPAPWLERLLPEWELLRCRPHIAPFHVNPVDVHVLRCVAEAKQVIEHDRDSTGTPEIAREFGRPDEVLLAAFLHDIGKGHTGEHSAAGAVIAERFAVRAGLNDAMRHRLVTSVRQHLLLPAVATRRDIADEEVIRETATQAGDADTLRLLYLLAVADARASGPNVWSAWKAQLMRSLYRRVLAVLEAGGPGTIAPDVESAVEALAGRFPAATVRAHLEGMGTDYLLSTPPATIGDHLEMIERASAGAAVRHDRAGEVDRVTVVTGDRPGLLQAITGALAGHHASVLGGVAYTRTDGVAIQVWHVGDALNSRFDERRWERLLSALPAAIDGTYSIDERLAEIRASYPERARADVPTTIHLDNDASRAHTVLEVTAADRRGLLYAVTRALYEQGIDIHLAKVDTIGPEVVDSFYIRRGNGRRIEDPDEQERLRECIASAIKELDR